MSQITPSPYPDEIDLRDILWPLWLGKWRILLWGLIFSLGTVIYQLGGLSWEKSSSAQMQVHFNFDGAETGLYPNRTKFSPLEILSGPVLRQVYARHVDPAVSFDDFSAALTMAPGFAGASRLDSVIANLAAQDKGLSVAEFNEAIAAYSQTLSQSARINSTLLLDLSLVNGNMAKASQILSDIPDTWATQAIKNRGVLNQIQPTLSSQIITAEEQDLLIKVNILSDTHKVLSKVTNDYINNPLLNDIADPSSGYKLSDLEHLLGTEGKYRIAILKEIVIKSGEGSDSEIWNKGFREARLAELERQRDSLERMVTVYNDALIQFSQQDDSQAQTGPGQSQTSPQIYSPQYSNDLVNTLLQLGSKMADPEYRKELLEKKIDFSSDLESVISEIEFYQSESDGKSAALDSTKISQLITDSSAKMAGLNDALTGIIQVANSLSVSDNGQLYDLLGSIVEVNSSNLSSRLLLKLILAFMMGSAVGVFVIFLRRVTAPTSTVDVLGS